MVQQNKSGIFENTKLFYELIRVAIGNAGCLSHTPTTAEWNKLYAMAKEQSLVGICFAGVQRLQKQSQCPPEMLYLQWMGMAAKVQQRNEVVSRRCKDVLDIVRKAGFRAFLMKGQCNGALYSIKDEGLRINDLPKLRQPGDIDIFVDGGRVKVMEFVQRTAPTSTINEIELEYRCFEDADVDMHYALPKMRHPFRNRKLNAYLLSWIEANYTNHRSIAAGVQVPCPVLEYDVVFQLEHVYGHFIGRGVGLRQIMDFYFLLQSAPDGYDYEAVKKGVEDIGLTKFACGLMWLLNNIFGMSMINVPWVPNERDGKFLLQEILNSGNFGSANERMHGVTTNLLKRAWVVNANAFRYWRFDHWAWFWSPLWRVYHFVWKRLHGYKK